MMILPDFKTECVALRMAGNAIIITITCEEQLEEVRWKETQSERKQPDLPKTPFGLMVIALFNEKFGGKEKVVNIRDLRVAPVRNQE